MLTREQILNMPTGREMDVEVARMMGWTEIIPISTEKKYRGIDPTCGYGSPIPYYSTDIHAAFEAVDKSNKYPLMEAMTRNNKGVSTWRVTIGNVHVYEATVPLAICRALLTTIQGEEKT